MQILIDISEDMYHDIIDGILDLRDSDTRIAVSTWLNRAVSNSTPLPKKLIDGDKLVDSLKGIERLHIDDELRSNILNAVYGNIIEINKEKSEE